MEFSLIVVPIYLVSVLTEGLYKIKILKKKYEFREAITNSIVGIGHLLSGLLVAGLIYKFRSDIYEFRLLNFPRSAWAYIILVFAEDYTWYWFHRISHRCRIFWCDHEIHHSSQFYNLTTAFRMTWVGVCISWIFWTPLCWIGFPPEWVILQQAISNLYTFFLHTETVKRLGPIELIFNTPSHHRAHHGTNKEYLDKNYGGIFVIWDRLHGTFVREEAHPRYGVSSGFQSENPLNIVTHMWIEFMQGVWKTPGWLNKVRYAFGRP